MTTNFLINNFKHLTTTPENVEQLKKLVLQMAVQGNLTAKWREDNTDVEPASVLLEKIKTEKEQLIKEGKIKKQNPLPPIVDEEKPFELPESWEWVRLNEISSVGTGATPLTSNTEYYSNGTIPWISSAATNNLFVYKPDKLITVKALKETNCTLCPIGTLVVAMYGQGKTRGQITELLIEATTNQACATIQLFLNDNDLRKFIKFFFIENYEKTRSYAFGGAQPNLNLLKIKNTIIPLPPLAEQQAIVSQVEKLFTQIDQLHALAQKRLNYREKSAKALFSKINHAENETELQETWQTLTAHFHNLTQSKESVKQLRQSILQMAVQGKLTAKWREENLDVEPASVLLEKIKAEKEQLINEGIIKRQKPLQPVSDDEKPFVLPEKWKWVRLIDYGLTNTGTTPSKNNPEFFGKDYPFVKPAEISLIGINYNTEDGLTEVGLKQGRLIRSNSVLMVCIGGSIGKSFYTDRDVSCNQQINTITPLASISSVFLHYFLQSIYFQSEVWSRASGGTTPIINKGKWERIPISLPPFEEQKAIVSKVKQLMAWCDELEKKIEKRDAYLDKMMQAVVKQAFRTETETVEME